MRYLIVIQDHGDPTKIRRRDLSGTAELNAGDELFLDEVLMRVWAVIDAPTKAGHDAIVLCGRTQP